ncbi:hypothetical protein PGTUg99_036994 [Puccinia graminis f. sp. tritici]|uniref:Uncharacterized protein n=1 Tax=Puccinia graminis f. sp. tritici TaxID=56615 RepID=A0A5B0PQH5_PUCGR|nr:hypothetical protein PGTUg99_036994 [Puccinia graminis f. sp. tritici]
MRCPISYPLLISPLLNAVCNAIGHLTLEDGFERLREGQPSGSEVVRDTFNPLDRAPGSSRAFSNPHRPQSPADALNVAVDSADDFLEPPHRGHASPDYFVKGWHLSPGSIDQFSVWERDFAWLADAQLSDSNHLSEHDEFPPMSNSDSQTKETTIMKAPLESSEPAPTGLSPTAHRDQESPVIHQHQTVETVDSPEVTNDQPLGHDGLAMGKHSSSSAKAIKISVKTEPVEFSDMPQYPSLKAQKPNVRAKKASSKSPTLGPITPDSGNRSQKPIEKFRNSSLQKSVRSSTKSSPTPQNDAKRRRLSYFHETIGKVSNLTPINQNPEGRRYGFPRLSFDWKAFVKEKSQIYTHKLSKILINLRVDRDHEMYISEANFASDQSRHIGISRGMSHELADGLVVQRMKYWENRITMITDHPLIWSKYWEDIDLSMYERKLESMVLAYLFPVFLFYVEMIDTIAPRENAQEYDYVREMTTACQSYVASSRFSLNISELKSSQHVEMSQLVLNHYIVKNKGKMRSRELHGALWTFLESWMYRHRRLLFGMHNREFPKRCKDFFDDTFSLTIENFKNKYSALNDISSSRKNTLTTNPVHSTH